MEVVKRWNSAVFMKGTIIKKSSFTASCSLIPLQSGLGYWGHLISGSKVLPAFDRSSPKVSSFSKMRYFVANSNFVFFWPEWFVQISSNLFHVQCDKRWPYAVLFCPRCQEVKLCSLVYVKETIIKKSSLTTSCSLIPSQSWRLLKSPYIARRNVFCQFPTWPK